jgi:hypothetical protein
MYVSIVIYIYIFFWMNQSFYNQTQNNYNSKKIEEDPQNTLHRTAKNKHQTTICYIYMEHKSLCIIYFLILEGGIV